MIMAANERVVTCYVFKDNGTFYCSEEIPIPENISSPTLIKEYIKDNYKQYMGMHLVFPLTEEWVSGTYPIMIPKGTRNYQVAPISIT